MGEYVDTVEAARILGVSVGTLRRWRALNKGPWSFVVSKRVMYDTHDIYQWISEQRRTSLRGGI
ncbi:helix-turn-helix domain-containing protein [Mycolicibacterium sp. CBMA 226]|uniref:helix-turn-helix transcriptional regulator n=1 Tax=Mycolicibacterium sp. CBMA 226 TaxID=2606611 RepID=UPI0012DF6A55|nr:helix-turn-helix domain-containing protein [Mycolicibacterium sp. CBMA 226]